MLRRSLRYPFAAVRARAMAAGLLRPDDFAEMAQLSSVDAALARLREKALFPPAAFHLPEGLMGSFRSYGGRIARTLRGVDRELVAGYLGRAGVENLKVISRGLVMKRPEEVFHPLLLSAGPEMEGGAEQLRRVASFEDLVHLQRRGPYGRIFSEALELPAENRLFHLESGLDRAFWEKIAGLLRRLASLDRRGAEDLLSRRADLERFNLLHRGLRAGLEEKKVLAALPPLGVAFPAGRIREAWRSASPQEALAALFPLPEVSRPLSAEGEVALRRRLRRDLRRVLRSHPFDISVSLASLLLKEMEIEDLQVVLNGLRLQRRSGIGALLVARLVSPL